MGAFKNRKDFSSVVATRLRHISDEMFNGAENLVTVIMPEVVGIIGVDGRSNGAFTGTKVENSFFPKLLRIGSRAFANCQIKKLDSDNFPSIESIS